MSRWLSLAMLIAIAGGCIAIPAGREYPPIDTTTEESAWPEMFYQRAVVVGLLPGVWANAYAEVKTMVAVPADMGPINCAWGVVMCLVASVPCTVYSWGAELFSRWEPPSQSYEHNERWWGQFILVGYCKTGKWVDRRSPGRQRVAIHVHGTSD